MKTEITAENLYLIAPMDLRVEAEKALNDCQTVELIVEPCATNPAINVTTVVFDDCRAGQAINGDAIWGDWVERRGWGRYVRVEGDNAYYIDGTQGAT